MTGLFGSPPACTVWLCVKQTMFFNVINLPLVPQYRERLLKISANSVRNIQNHAKVEKTSATCNNKRLTWFVSNLHVLWGLKHGTGGRLLVIRTIFLSCKINWYFVVIYILRLYCFFLIFPPIFPTQQKNFCSYWRIFQIIPYPTSHPKNRVVNVCKHKFACTNVTPKRRNRAHFITHAPHCAWVMRGNCCVKFSICTVRSMGDKHLMLFRVKTPFSNFYGIVTNLRVYYKIITAEGTNRNSWPQPPYKCHWFFFPQVML